MRADREDAAVEKDAAAEGAVAVGAAEGAVAATGGSAPSAVSALAAVAVVEPGIGEHVEEEVAVVAEVAVDLDEESLKRKREQYELIDQAYKEAELGAEEEKDEAVEFDEEVDDKLSEEDDEDVDESKESRDSKSRYVLRRLQNGEIPYRNGPNRLYGNIACPFCCARIKSDYDSLIMHGTSIGSGNGRNRKPRVQAKHAAFVAFLRKYAKGHLPFYLPRI